MRAVGLKVLKNKLSEYVRAVENGEIVLIADRERIVAEIVPPRQDRSPRVPDALLAQMVRDGVLTPALLPPGPPPATEPVACWRDLQAELERDRGDR
jgi:antitoxin (DNA-binding transcriptional repressor) of toxin-antitoxin stability system